MLYNTPEEVLNAVNDFVRSMNEEGGSVEMPMHFERSPRVPNPFRLSSSGRCVRELAYKKLVPEEIKPPDIRAYNIFMLGDILHESERALIQKVAPLDWQEKVVRFYVDEEVGYVEGHCDGRLELAGGHVLLDVKTAGDSGFSRMMREGVGYEYRAQLNAYMDATGIHQSVIWAYNKNTSERAVLPVSYEPALVEEVRERFRAVHAATLDSLPPRPYEPRAEMRQRRPTGREYLHFKCAYCPVVQRCWEGEGFELDMSSGKPRYIRNSKELLDGL